MQMKNKSKKEIFEMKKVLLVLVLSILFPIVSHAQVDREETRSVLVHFRQGAVTLDENYMDNKATLTEFAKVVKAYYSDTTAHFRQIRVVSSASPEGGKALNARLAKQRAEAITNWISREISANLDYAVESTGIDWELLIKLIEEREEVPYRDEVLDVLHNVPAIVVEGGKEVEKRYDALRALRGGVSYRWIYANLFPQMRYASARCEFWWETIPELLITSGSPVRYAAEGATGVIAFDKNVVDNVVPTVRSKDGWVDELIPTGKDITFTVAPNPTAEQRSTTIVIECYNKTYEVVVEQYGVEPELTLSKCSASHPCEGATETIPFAKNVVDDVLPVATTAADWIESIAVSEEGITYTVAENPTTEPRKATILVDCYGKTQELVVEQSGVAPAITLSKYSEEYPSEATTDTIGYTRNDEDDDTKPVVTSDAKWIDSFVVADDSFTYNVAENKSTDARTATILVDCYDDVQEVVVAQAAAPCRPFYMAIKNNMLYDLAAVPNLGAEFYLGKKFSIAANYMHAWWKKEEKSFYWRYYGADASIRWWFGKPSRIKPLQGHHLGVNYQILTYDFQLGKTGIMAGMPGDNLAARANHIVALEYGYSLPVAKRLNLDFSIAGGYHWGLFEEYETVDGHPVWQATKRRQYFGPTKVEISLVWLIGCDNYNKDKGGKR